MRIRSHHVATLLLAGAVFLSSLAWFGYRTPDVYATCGVGANILVGNPASGATVNGLYTLKAGTTSTATLPSSVTFTLTAPTALVIGNAVSQMNGSTMLWSFPWDTTTLPNGGYQLTAIAHYGVNTAADCSSNPVAFTIQNSTGGGTQAPTLTISVTPNNWSGLPGQKASFSVTGVYKNAAGIGYAIGASGLAATYAWTTSTGTVTPITGQVVNLIPGAKVGTYTLNVAVTVNGLTSNASSIIKINPPTAAAGTTTSPNPTPSPVVVNSPAPIASPEPIGVGGTTPLTSAQILTLTSTPTVFRPVEPTNSAPVVSVPILGCLQEKIGSNYAAISSGQTQPTASDRLNGSTCFSGADKIPASIAPVVPAHITEVTSSQDIVKLTSIKNATITNADGQKIAVLFLTGTSSPNSSVFLYFFSDPMVLRAETDSSGKYNYVLQNPLAPGKHEVYAVAAKDSATFVRTQALPITVAAAASSGQNGSLVIESKLQPVQVGFAIASFLMVLAAILILFRMIRRTKPVAAAPTVSYASPSVANPSTSTPIQHQIGTVFMPAPPSDSPLATPPTDKTPPQ